MIMVNRGDSSLSISTEYRDLGEYDVVKNPYDKGFRFIVTLINRYSQSIEIDPSILTMHFTQSTYTFDGSVRSAVDTDLGYELCDFENEFSHTDIDMEKSRSINLYCPKRKDFQIAGNIGGKHQIQIELMNRYSR